MLVGTVLTKHTHEFKSRISSTQTESRETRLINSSASCFNVTTVLPLKMYTVPHMRLQQWNLYCVKIFDRNVQNKGSFIVYCWSHSVSKSEAKNTLCFLILRFLFHKQMCLLGCLWLPEYSPVCTITSGSSGASQNTSYPLNLSGTCREYLALSTLSAFSFFRGGGSGLVVEGNSWNSLSSSWSSTLATKTPLYFVFN